MRMTGNPTPDTLPDTFIFLSPQITGFFRFLTRHLPDTRPMVGDNDYDQERQDTENQA